MWSQNHDVKNLVIQNPLLILQSFKNALQKYQRRWGSIMTGC
uniref:Uncharacterized protein n=1 Tax=Triticum urartu TaxID=4572 RepID=A0A8R7QUF0_TRIUA